MLAAVVHGTLLAFGLILPLGSQNVFIISQGAQEPRLGRALPAVLAASLCDTLLILLAVPGVSLVVLTVPSIRTALLGAGVVFLLVVGWGTWRTDPGTAEADKGAAGWSVRRQVLFAAAGRLVGRVGALRRVLDRVAAAIMWTTALHLARQLRIAP